MVWGIHNLVEDFYIKIQFEIKVEAKLDQQFQRSKVLSCESMMPGPQKDQPLGSSQPPFQKRGDANGIKNNDEGTLHPDRVF